VSKLRSNYENNPHYNFGIWVLLAAASGVSKIMLMPQEVDFFANYGFSNAMLIAFGADQLAGGILMLMAKTRMVGTMLVAITFLWSAVLLVIAGNIPVAIVTVVCVLLLVFVARPARDPDVLPSADSE
jgi:hypothetical protein